MRKHTVALAMGALFIASLTTVGVASPGFTESDVQDDRSAPDGLVISSHTHTLTVTHTPAPRAKRAGGKFTVYPVPTSAATLRRITTAPDGSMWFVERDANRIGRITTSGAITEINLPTQTSEGNWVKDLDVDSAGNVWVVWDQGRKVTRYDPGANSAHTWGFSLPYGEEVRVGSHGTTWVTASFDEKGIIRISGDDAVWHANAPECDGALGRGRDGLMWCQQFDKLIRVKAAGSGGTAYPLPANATYPYSVATGPNHRIWFGRDSGGSMFTSPAWGNIGWVTNGNQVKVVRTGDRTAPRSLVTGRDGNVWFVSVGAAKGIGHVNANRVGAVAKVGNYRPTSVTYGRDGAIWFTDSANNSIVRVARSHLWRTTVNVGSNSQLRPHAQPKVSLKKRVDANRKRSRASLRVACGAGLVPCAGRITVKAGKAKVGSGSYSVAQRRSKTATVNLTKKARTLLKKRARVKVRVTFTPKAGAKRTQKTTLTR